MAVQTFNETFLKNADVPETGSKAGAGRAGDYDTRTAATGNPAGVQSFDPAANLRVTTTTKQATRTNPNAPVTAKFRPKAVDHFSGENI